MMFYEEEYGGLLAEYQHEQRGFSSALRSIIYELESISAMVYTVRGSIENDADIDHEARVLMLAGNKAFQLCEEVRVMDKVLHPEDSDDTGGAK